MLLSKNIAEQIVVQLSKVMEQHINIMDINGIIISSTDPLRIGTVHGGAVRILKEHLSELVIESDDEYIGSRNGINLPIEFNSEIIGVIGLTGRSTEVIRYGQIIKKMTEVLLLDTYVREQKNIEQKARDRFLEEWIFGKYDINHPTEFKQRADMLSIDILTPKRIMVVSLKNKDLKPVSDQVQTDISHRLRNLVGAMKQAYLFRTSTLFIFVLNVQSDQEIIMFANQVSEIVSSQFNCVAFVGIDSEEKKPIKASFKNASVALQISMKSNQNMSIYDALNFDVFINSLMPKFRNEYLLKLFKNSEEKEMDDYIQLLKVFYACEGSIQEASQNLYIHKNTLQYRLNKIGSITGFDPRKISSSYLFITAIKIYESLKSEEL